MKQYLKQKTLSVAVTKTVVTNHENGSRSWRSEPDGTKSGVVAIYIDVDALLEDLGQKALRSRGKKARLGSGYIEVKVQGKVVHRKEGT